MRTSYRLLKSTAALAGSCLLATTAVAQNDDCLTPDPLVAGITPFDTTAATAGGPLMPCGGTTTAPLDIWYSYTGTGGETITVNTCTGNTGYDSRLQVLAGNDCATATNVICNDDFCGLQSQVSWIATGGQDYLIRVGGFLTNTGTGELDVTISGPPNDECAGAIAIGTGGTAFNNAAATDSPEPWPCGSTASSDLWYIVTGTAGSTMTITTCSAATFDTKLQAFDSDDCGNLVSLGCNDDACGLQSSLTFPASGLPQLVRVGGFAGGTGSGTLGVSDNSLPNDECVGAIPLALGANPFDTTGAGTSGTWSCALGGADLWYSYSGCAGSTVTIDTCGSSYDTAITVFEGGCASLVEVACNDDFCGLQSSITYTAGLNPALIRVGGFNSNTGSGDINVTETPLGISNDECATATAVTDGEYLFCNTGATTSSAWPCGLGGNDIWYSYTADVTCNKRIETCGSTYDTTLEIFDGNDCNALNSIQCNDDACGLQSGITFAATAGSTYLFRIGGFNSNTGNGILRIAGDPIGTTLCVGVANSTGNPSALAAGGSDSVAANCVTLTATGLPNNSVGFFLTSTDTVFVANPGGSLGNICIASLSMGRHDAVMLNAGSTGSVSFSPDLTSLPRAGGPISVAVGETHYWQLWYRDSVGGLAVSNFSDAVCITFQ